MHASFLKEIPTWIRRQPHQNQIAGMQKFSAIVLLLSFAFFQYARQLSYWECRILNAFSSSGQCDCEKILTKTNNTAKESPVVHFHVHPDDLFIFQRFLFEIAAPRLTDAAVNNFTSGPVLNGFHLPPWQPPNS